MKKKYYVAPRVMKTASVFSEGSLLAGSVVTKDTKIETMGQEVKSYDFSGSSFNQIWE